MSSRMPTAAELDEAVRLLEAGQLVAFPTETVYGLGADAESPEAVARIFAAKAPDGLWEAKNGRGRLQDIELLAQSFALRTGAPARAVPAQLRAGARAGLIDAASAEEVAQAWRFLWRLHCAARLLTEGRLDMEAAGRGGQEFLLRETGQDTLDGLATELAAVVERSGRIVDEAVQAGAGEPAAGA